MKVYEKVREYIVANGYKQVAIAKKAGIPNATFNAIMNGKRTLYADDLSSICIALKVMNLIESLSDKEITEDMTDELNLIQMNYHSLNKEQKKLVTNYDELKKALEFLKKVKDESQAKNIQEEIDLINTDKLTAEDTSVGELRRKYNALSKEQQKLVENAHKLEEYEKVIQTRIREKEEIEKIENQNAEQERLFLWSAK